MHLLSSLSLFFVFLLLCTSLPAALPVLPEPEPIPVQSFKSPPSSVIPAFPEQSDVASSSSCHLSLPADLTALSSSLSSLSPARICPPLAAFLYSAYSSSALSLPSSPSRLLPDLLPDLPDDPESCAGEVERALRTRGVHLPRVNSTCDAAYCFCGVRLRRLTCAGGPFVPDPASMRWAPLDPLARKLQKKCRSPGLAGCSRCLRVLNQLNRNVSTSASKDSRECQLMGLTWLLSKNTTLYLPTAASVLGSFMSSAAGEAGPANSCSVPHDEMPFAVGSDVIDGRYKPSSAVKSLPINILGLLAVNLIIICICIAL